MYAVKEMPEEFTQKEEEKGEENTKWKKRVSIQEEGEEEKHEEKKKKEKKTPAGGILVDGSKMKDDLMQDLDKKEYSVFDFYHETGFWQAVAKSDRFGHLTLGVISMNAVWIGVDSDHNTKPPGETELVFVIADQFFCIFFSFEWLARFLAFKKKHNCLKDGWFKFDSVLVSLMVYETWLSPLIQSGGDGGGMGDASMLRLLRLLRLTRMTRLMRSVPELMVLLKGMIAAARSVSSTLALLIIFDYVFGIIFKQQTTGDEELEAIYGQIPEAMWNLIMIGTLLDNITDNLNLLRERNKPMCALFLFWVLLSSFTILNMLIGVLCEVVTAVTEAEKEKSVVSFAKSKFLSVLERIDKNKNGTLSEGEFDNFLMDEEVQGALEVLEVDRDNLSGLKDVLFSHTEKNETPQPPPPLHPCSPDDSGEQSRSSVNSRKSLSNLMMGTKDIVRELPFSELLEMILDLRASNPAMVSHVVDLRKHLRTNQKESRSLLKELCEDITEISTDQASIDQKMDQIIEHQHKLETDMQKLSSSSLPVSSPSPPDQSNINSKIAKLETDMHTLFSQQEKRIDQMIALQQLMMTRQEDRGARSELPGLPVPEDVELLALLSKDDTVD